MNKAIERLEKEQESWQKAVNRASGELAMMTCGGHLSGITEALEILREEQQSWLIPERDGWPEEDAGVVLEVTFKNGRAKVGVFEWGSFVDVFGNICPRENIIAYRKYQPEPYKEGV